MHISAFHIYVKNQDIQYIHDSQLMHDLGSKSIYKSDNSFEQDIFTHHLQVVYNDYVFQLCSAVLSSSEIKFLPFSDNFALFKCFAC